MRPIQCCFRKNVLLYVHSCIVVDHITADIFRGPIWMSSVDDFKVKLLCPAQRKNLSLSVCFCFGRSLELFRRQLETFSSILKGRTMLCRNFHCALIRLQLWHISSLFKFLFAMMIHDRSSRDLLTRIIANRAWLRKCTQLISLRVSQKFPLKFLSMNLFFSDQQ